MSTAQAKLNREQWRGAELNTSPAQTPTAHAKLNKGESTKPNIHPAQKSPAQAKLNESQ